MSDTKKYRLASEKMGRQFYTTDHFICDAINWLSENIGDLHIEYHANSGWQVSTCYIEEWISGDSLQSVLANAVLSIDVERIMSSAWDVEFKGDKTNYSLNDGQSI